MRAGTHGPPEARPQPGLRAAPVPRQAAQAAPRPRPSRGHSRGVGAAQGLDLPLLLLLEAGAGGQRRGGRAGAAALGEGEQPVHPPAAAPGGRGAPAAPHPGLAPSRMRAAAPPPLRPPRGRAAAPRPHGDTQASSPPRARDVYRGRAEEGVARPADRRRGGAKEGRPGRRLAPPPSVRGEGGKAAARGDDVMALCGGGSASCVSCGDWRFWGVGAAAGPRQTRRGPARPGPPGSVSERATERARERPSERGARARRPRRAGRGQGAQSLSPRSGCAPLGPAAAPWRARDLNGNPNGCWRWVQFSRAARLPPEAGPGAPCAGSAGAGSNRGGPFPIAPAEGCCSPGGLCGSVGRFQGLVRVRGRPETQPGRGSKPVGPRFSPFAPLLRLARPVRAEKNFSCQGRLPAWAALCRPQCPRVWRKAQSPFAASFRVARSRGIPRNVASKPWRNNAELLYLLSN